MNNVTTSLDIADPSDWLKTTVPKLAPVESALRCQVCKDFFDTPMITSCSHTFCSLCIRRCLTNDGKCPVCRTSDQELRLRRNWTVQEVVEAFQAVRPSLSSFATRGIGNFEIESPRSKRKLDDTDYDDDTDEPKVAIQRRKTRSQDKQQPDGEKYLTAQAADEESQAENIGDDNGNGSAACPICGQKMKEEAVFLHLDTHNEPDRQPSPNPRKLRRAPSVEVVGTSRKNIKPPERLPQLNYSLMKDVALRKKLSELGIPSTGPRSLLIRRHAEWINIVNANADSSRPKSKREMLRELDIWDRSTGRSIASSGNELNNTGSIMRKDFDGAAWSANHSSDFQDLISKARNTRKTESSPRKSGRPAHVIMEQDSHASPSSPQLADSIPERPINSIISGLDDT